MSNEDINKDDTNFSGEEGNFGLPENYFDSFSASLFKKIAAEDELKEYPLLSSVQKNNPFAVPTGYFEKKEELFQYPLLVSLKKNNPFAVPTGYFEKKEELFQYPLLVSLKKNNPFAVPATYFETKEELFKYPLLMKNKTNGFSVPNAYFNTLSERIIHAVSIEEEKETYPLLSSYNNEAVFRTPDSYFEEFELPTGIHNAVTSPKGRMGGVVILLYKRIKLSYKVAAAIALLIGLSVLFYIQQEKPLIQNTDCATFACLDKNDILNSGYILHVSDDNIIDLIDEKSLSDSLLLKTKRKHQKVDMSDVSDNVDINTITDNL